jgi:hypothetical protein
MEELLELVKNKGRENVNYPQFIKNNILHNGDRLLYLTLTGSHLYGYENMK